MNMHGFDNSFLISGFILLVSGFLMTTIKSVPQTIFSWFLRFFTVGVECPDHHQSYIWVQAFLKEQNFIFKVKNYSTLPITNDDKIQFIPSEGKNIFKYKDYYAQVYIYRKELESGSFYTQKLYYENIGFRFLFAPKSIIEEFLLDAKNNFEQLKDNRVYVNAEASWSCRGTYKFRPLSSIYLKDQTKEEVYDDLKKFINSEKWYQKMSIPYRRGYLLEGKPGNGKTSLIKGLAKELKYDVCILNINDPKITDITLFNLFSSVPNKTFIVMEDIDRFLDPETFDNKTGISFNGLLNAIDGIISKENIVLFMTTNHLEKLDKALIRPGRIDRIVNIDNPNIDQCRKYCTDFFPKANNEIINNFSKHAINKNWSMSTIQEHLLKNRENPELILQESI